MTDIFERNGKVSNWDGHECDQYPPAQLETPVTQEVVAALFHLKRAQQQLEKGHDATYFMTNAVELLKVIRDCFNLINGQGREELPEATSQTDGLIEESILAIEAEQD
jgi:hypothetical protein